MRAGRTGAREIAYTDMIVLAYHTGITSAGRFKRMPSVGLAITGRKQFKVGIGNLITTPKLYLNIQRLKINRDNGIEFISSLLSQK